MKFSNGSRPNFKEFRLGVRDFSDLRSCFIGSGPDYTDSRSNLKNFRPYVRDFMSDFKDFRVFTSDFKFSSRIPEIFG